MGEEELRLDAMAKEAEKFRYAPQLFLSVSLRLSLFLRFFY